MTPESPTLESLLDRSAAMAVELDGDGRIIQANQRWSETVGTTLEAARGQALAAFMAPRDASAYREMRASLLAEKGELAGFATSLVDRDGHVWPALASETAHLDASGRIAGSVVIFLKTAPTVRPALATEQRIDALVERTVGMIGHDFNNNLAVIIGNLQLLEDRLGSTTKPISLAQRAAARAAERTTQLLTIARRRSMRPETLRPAAWLQTHHSHLEQTMPEGIAFSIQANPAAWPVLVDEGQLLEAVARLTRNAVQATVPPGKISIAVDNLSYQGADPPVGAPVPPGDYVTISVIDSGQGIAEDILPRVREPFFSTRDELGAAGLGLAMVQGFARQSGGDLELGSEPGKGTTATLYLPRLLDRETGAGRLPSASALLVASGKGEKILVVEDNEELLQYIDAMLTDLGYKVTAVGNGKKADEAMEAMSEGAGFDLLLTDVILSGGINGPDLATRFRDADPKIKVLFMTGFARDAFNDSNIDDNDRVLQKPFTVSELSAEIQATLHGEA